MQKQLDEYFNQPAWNLELAALRTLLQDCMLTEQFKWKQPCYAFNNSNVVILGRFKEYCALSFLKGALLKDTDKILHSPGENSQSVRVMKFTNSEEITKNEALIKAYVIEAIEVEKLGLKVALKKNDSLDLPTELTDLFKKNSTFKTAFKALTPGRQRGYVLFFSAAKQSSTRITRINKYLPRILIGKGINDCTCGHSKKPPGCDGSHKFYNSKSE